MNKIQKIITISFVLIVEIFLLIRPTMQAPLTDAQMDEYAQNIKNTCNKKGTYLQTCYQDHITDLMTKKSVSMEDAFDTTKALQKYDPSYFYCHVLSHKLAQTEVQKDQSKWKKVLTRCPTDMCSGGCIHGVFQEKFNDEILSDNQIDQVVPELQGMCDDRPEWTGTEWERQGCNHAIGHTTVYISGADMKKAAQICYKIADRPQGEKYLQTCVEGMFMQLFQPQEPEDEAFVKDVVPTKETLKEFCNQFDEYTKPLCLKEGWALFIDEIQTPQGIINYCSYALNSSQEELCFNRIANSLMTINDLNIDKVKPICLGLPAKWASKCIADAAAALMTTDYSLVSQSIDLCDSVSSLGYDNECYENLSFHASYTFHKDSSNFINLCNSMPVGWQQSCLQQDNSSGENYKTIFNQ